MNKTLTIERPALLSTFARVIQWKYAHGVDLRTVSRKTLLESVDLATAVGGGPTAVAQYAKATQLLEGAVMQVDARVSRDLEVSTVTCSLKHLSWPATSLEIRFADPDLPAILAVPISTTGGMGLDLPEMGAIFIMDTKDGGTHSLALPERLWQQYVANQYNANMTSRLLDDQPVTDEEAQAMRYAVCLAVKVLAYASVPQHRPALLTTNAERKAAGLHPKHTIPGQKTLVVRYLPRVVRDQPAPAGEPTGQTHRFLGRAGHIRFYTADRYTEMKGKWQWIAPVPPPEGIQITYKVRKVPFVPVSLPVAGLDHQTTPAS